MTAFAKPMVSILLVLLSAPAAALEANTATRAQLEQLQGLGVAMTDRILLARADRPFSDWDDLAARVPGIRGKRAEQLRQQGLKVNGKDGPAGEGKRR